MDKKIVFNELHASHINWNSLIPEMLDVWRALKITKSDTGVVVVEVDEEPKKEI